MTRGKGFEHGITTPARGDRKRRSGQPSSRCMAREHGSDPETDRGSPHDRPDGVREQCVIGGGQGHSFPALPCRRQSTFSRIAGLGPTTNLVIRSRIHDSLMSCTGSRFPTPDGFQKYYIRVAGCNMYGGSEEIPA